MREGGEMLIRQRSLGIGDSVRSWWRTILDYVYPPICVGCGTPGVDWCDDCHGTLRIISEPLCNRCGRPLAHSRESCQNCQSFPGILQVRSYAHYEGSLLRAILHLKYRPNRTIARIMGGWLAGLCMQEGWKGSLVLAVPLGKIKKLQRGYNQAGLIADGLTDHLKIKRGRKVLKRIRETRSQVGLDIIGRFQNVQDAFRADRRLVEGQIVFLVDDLLTTGATLSACTEALQKAGVQRVYGLTVARA
jgi:competence protein ComFC